MIDEKSTNGFDHMMAASIQDMKNSLNILQHTLDKVHSPDIDSNVFGQGDAVVLHHEVTRMQKNVEQLYSVFLLEKGALPLQLKETYLLELVEEKLVSHKGLFDCLGLKVEVDVDSDLYIYADGHLLAQVLDVAIVNAARYTLTAIKLKASHSNGGVLISIEDDGKGYPDRVLKDFEDVRKNTPLADLTSQALGWYYCHSVAKMHRVKRRHGWIKLSNRSELGGSLFEVFIP